MSMGDRQDVGSASLAAIDQQPPPKRKLSSRISLLHLVAVASGVLAFMLILSWMQGQQALVEVAVASDPVRPGVAIDADMIEFITVPASTEFVDRMLSPEEVTLLDGSVATRTISPGEPILDSDLRPVASREGLRAMSIPFDVTLAVAGDIVAGDRVDIIAEREGVTWYAASDIEVLAVPGDSTGAFGSTADFSVTLAVDDATALALATAYAADTIHLVRSTGAPEVTLFSSADQPQDGDAGLDESVSVGSDGDG